MKLVVILVLGLAIIGIAGYYFVVVVPQQQFLFLQLQQQATEAQTQAAIAYCTSVGQQYDFATGGCVPIPITVSISNWVTNATQPLWSWMGDTTQNIWSGLQLATQQFTDAISLQNISQQLTAGFDYVNPLNPESIWFNLGSLFGGS